MGKLTHTSDKVLSRAGRAIKDTGFKPRITAISMPTPLPRSKAMPTEAMAIDNCLVHITISSTKSMTGLNVGWLDQAKIIYSTLMKEIFHRPNINFEKSLKISF